ncbi:hypothetical protein AVEN_78687-1 [Araneus ventricosus]|uniref:Uncharacterized protein n=1 Tax=Araneus ventricosus TaxID=182803 RepID=A0A4Y2WJS4_ARAVE|nr:hypothetical protein AVEN_78687-1 [Araneus ventricosus]
MISGLCHGAEEVLTFGGMRWNFLPVSHSFCQSWVESFFLRWLLGCCSAGVILLFENNPTDFPSTRASLCSFVPLAVDAALVCLFLSRRLLLYFRSGSIAPRRRHSEAGFVLTAFYGAVLGFPSCPTFPLAFMNSVRWTCLFYGILNLECLAILKATFYISSAQTGLTQAGKGQLWPDSVVCTCQEK